MKTKRITRTMLVLLTLILPALAQQHTENKADQTLRGSSRVNNSSLGMEFEIPLGSYPGRGIDIPVNITYSSKVWRLDYGNSQPAVNNPDTCIAMNEARFGENSASGWTTSMAIPYIEYVGLDNLYSAGGSPLGSDDPNCSPNVPPQYTDNAWIRRIALHLPGGETHELRMNDNVLAYPGNSNCEDTDPQTPCTGNDPSRPENWNGWYYAVDSSNIRYFEDRTNGEYFVQMPDGSRYDFGGQIGRWNNATIRKATLLSDRNGNSTTYHEGSTAFPNGYWTDTIGRVIPVPLRPEAPASPIVQTVSLPGIGGSAITYRLNWKRLKGSTPEESALSDFSAQLRYVGDKFHDGTGWRTRPAGAHLFGSETEAWVLFENQLFNPIVLASVELPTGQSYRFGYNIYGEIDEVRLPSGGEEKFVFNSVGSIADLSGPYAAVNRGVTRNSVSESIAGNSPMVWNYSTEAVSPAVFKVGIVNPDGVRVERMVHRGRQGALFGFDSALAGMSFEERVFSSNNLLVSKKLTTWARNQLPINSGPLTLGLADWHPRIRSVESIDYNGTGAGVSTSTVFAFEDEDNLNNPSKPVLTRSVANFDYVGVGLPRPPAPIRVAETIHLVNDEMVPALDREAYLSANMVGLISAGEVKDANGATVSRTETRYDEPGYSSGTRRGNPTSKRDWDSSRGPKSNPDAYVTTRGRFDAFGNRVEMIDPRGGSTITQYDAAYNTFPVRVTTPIPDQTGTKGANTALVTEAAFDPATGLQLSAFDANGLETRLEYDPATLRISAVRNYFAGSQVGGSVETIYNDIPGNNWVRERTQIDGNIWKEVTTSIDGLGRSFRTEELDSKGNIFVNKEFDTKGRVRRISNPFRTGEPVNWTSYDYDEAGRLRSIVLPDGSTVRTDWGVLMGDFAGITKTITDQAGKKRLGVTDPLGRMRRVVEDPGGLDLTTDYVLDANGNIRRTIQGAQSRFFAFDSLNRLIFSKMPEQGVNQNLVYTDQVTGNGQWAMKYEYDAAGNIVRTTDPRGIIVNTTYDSINRMTKRDYSDDTPDVDFYFDGAGSGAAVANARGKTTRIVTSVSETRFTGFDPFGRTLASRQMTDGLTFDSGYAYNLSGALISETYPSGRAVTNELGQNSKLSAVFSQQTNSNRRTVVNQIDYTASGQIGRMRFGNGRWETAEYNSRQQIVRIGLGYSVTDKSLIDLAYGYGSLANNNGALRSQSLAFRGLNATIVQNYEYDQLNRIGSAIETVNSGQDTWKQLFEYDRYGNRRLQNGTTTLNPAFAAKIINPTADPSTNRLIRDQDGDNLTDYSYDAAGNLIADAENRRFLFDGENRIKAFFRGTNSGTAPDGLYRYDGDGRRVMKITATEKTIFVYDAFNRLVAEYSTAIPVAPKTNYLTADHLGSPRVVTDAGGAVVSRHDYTAFGDDVARSLGIIGGRSASQGYGREDEIRKQYTGYEHDEETGLEFAQARFYKSSLGRFTSPDPLIASTNLKDPQTFNRYSYALNSPYKFVDPLGLISSSTGANGGGSGNAPPTRGPRPRPRQRGADLTPNPKVAVPKSVQEEARAATAKAVVKGTDQTAMIQQPKSMIKLKVALSNYVYTQVGAATSQSVANSKHGSVQPETVTVTEGQSTTASSGESTTTSVTVTASQEAGVTAGKESTSDQNRSATGSDQTALSGPSTDIRGTLNTIENETNLAITNYLNENSDSNGMINVTVVDENNVRSRGKVSRDEVKRYLQDFVRSVRDQAYRDFGGM